MASIAIGTTNDATLGAYLTGQGGMTLYIFSNDTADTSNCSGQCATTWPPLTAASGATIAGPSGAMGTFTIISRSDGSMQVAYNHQPLNYFSGDSVAGDTKGQGVGGKWVVAPLTADAGASPAATSGAAATPAATDTAPAATSASP